MTEQICSDEGYGLDNEMIKHNFINYLINIFFVQDIDQPGDYAHEIMNKVGNIFGSKDGMIKVRT